MSLKSIRQKIKAWQHYREGIRQLSRLPDRELADLGITRIDIKYCARHGVLGR